MIAIARRTALALPLGVVPLRAAAAADRDYEVPFVGTPPVVVQAMLDLAEVGSDDLLIDLGSGDGRIAIAAGRRGARAVGVEIDPLLVRRATYHAAAEGLGDRVRFRRDDLFRAAIRDASVIALYLLPATNLRLRPRLLTELRPGTRVVAHAFGLGDWAPDEHRVIDGRNIYLWTVPAVAGGLWRMRTPNADDVPLRIEQRFQTMSGTLGGAVLADTSLTGDRIGFSTGGLAYTGTVGERTIDGAGWSAERVDEISDPAPWS